METKIEGDENQYIFASPVFANNEGTKIICHGYKRTEFTHGLLHCFNRPVSVFELSVDVVEGEWKYSAKVLINKEETNIFANISQCGNYMLYFGGSDVTHTYYMDLIILKREADQWKEIHRRKDAFVGYYDTAKSETF